WEYPIGDAPTERVGPVRCHAARPPGGGDVREDGAGGPDGVCHHAGPVARLDGHTSGYRPPPARRRCTEVGCNLPAAQGRPGTCRCSFEGTVQRAEVGSPVGSGSQATVATGKNE